MSSEGNGVGGHEQTSSEAVIRVHADAGALADAVAGEIVAAAREAAAAGRKLCVALSGGSTPKRLYERLAEAPHAGRMPWEALDIFWGDERCVPPEHADSNYRMTASALLDRVPIPKTAIHRLRGESDPAAEAARYESEIRRVVPRGPSGMPRFDLVLLGMGDDGHTASLFPGQTLAPSGPLCGVARHPQTATRRVSFTLGLINAAASVSFLVTGGAKAELVRAIVARDPIAERWPAAQVRPGDGDVVWHLDREAGARLDRGEGRGS